MESDDIRCNAKQYQHMMECANEKIDLGYTYMFRYTCLYCCSQANKCVNKKIDLDYTYIFIYTGLYCCSQANKCVSINITMHLITTKNHLNTAKYILATSTFIYNLDCTVLCYKKWMN